MRLGTTQGFLGRAIWHELDDEQTGPGPLVLRSRCTLPAAFTDVATHQGMSFASERHLADVAGSKEGSTTLTSRQLTATNENDTNLVTREVV